MAKYVRLVTALVSTIRGAGHIRFNVNVKVNVLCIVSIPPNVNYITMLCSVQWVEYRNVEEKDTRLEHKN